MLAFAKGNDLEQRAALLVLKRLVIMAADPANNITEVDEATTTCASASNSHRKALAPPVPATHTYRRRARLMHVSSTPEAHVRFPATSS